MHKPLLAILTALSLGWAATGSASAATPGVRDAANMFSAGALKEADEKLAAVHMAHGWEIVFETIGTLGGKPVDRLTEDKARSLQIRGIYFLVAKKEGKTHFWIERPALKVFSQSDGEAATKKMIAAFKEKKFDDGLLDAVNYLAEVAGRSPVAASRTAPASPAPAGRQGPPQPPQARPGGNGAGSFLVTALIIGGVIVVVLLVIRMIAGAARGASGGPGYGYGPGGGGGGGGGFFSSLLGGLGGVFLGNWLYNSMFGGHQARADDNLSGSGSAPGDAGGYDDQGVSGGGDWSDSGGDSGSGDEGGGDWGGSDDAGGGDFGGGDSGGGDFGGGDFGGGDFGGGDMGGGDW